MGGDLKSEALYEQRIREADTNHGHDHYGVTVSRFMEEDKHMRSTAKKINPEDYILSVLSPEDRLDAAFQVAREAFRKTKLTMRDIDRAVNKEKKSSQ